MALQRAADIFGLTPSPLLSASNVAGLTSDLKKMAGEKRRPCQGYLQKLRERMTKLGIGPDHADRPKTAAATLTLLDRLHSVGARDVVPVLVDSQVATSESAMGECRAKAGELEGNLDAASWDLFEAIGKLTDERQTEARQILTDVKQALVSDEHVVPLATALKGAQAKAVRLLSVVTPQLPVTPQPAVTTVTPPRIPGKKVVGQGTKENLTLDAAERELSELRNRTPAGHAIRISLSWVVEEGGGS